jgi:rhamnosyltransferase subunit A
MASAQDTFMPIEKLVVPLPTGSKVYVERHVFNPDFESVILINGALATTASFGQTIKYLGERYNAICFDLPYAGKSKTYNTCDFVLTKDDEVDNLLHDGATLGANWGAGGSRGATHVDHSARAAMD